MATQENNHVEVFPVGSAESVWVTAPHTNKLIILDYAHTKTDSPDDKRTDLRQELLDRVGEGGSVDFVSFSHADKDHLQGASDVFHMEHAEKYQGSGRVKIEMMCVPARLITESRNDLSADARVVQREARHRLIKGKGIVVISEPDGLNEWLENEDIDPKDRRDCIATAGTVLSNFSLEEDGVEVFVHSPFSYQDDDGNRYDRNASSSVFQVSIDDGDGQTAKLLFMADVDCEVTADIVRTTEKHGNKDRLEHDVMVVSHHGSRNSLIPEGSDEVDPDVDRLFREYGRSKATYVASSRSMSDKKSSEDKLPPHQDAMDYYEEIAEGHGGEAIITMEYPSEDEPAPVSFSASGEGKGFVKRKASTSESSASSAGNTGGGYKRDGRDSPSKRAGSDARRTAARHGAIPPLRRRGDAQGVG